MAGEQEETLGTLRRQGRPERGQCGGSGNVVDGAEMDSAGGCLLPAPPLPVPPGAGRGSHTAC